MVGVMVISFVIMFWIVLIIDGFLKKIMFRVVYVKRFVVVYICVLRIVNFEIILVLKGVLLLNFDYFI